jgi:hypothetical protein
LIIFKTSLADIWLFSKQIYGMIVPTLINHLTGGGADISNAVFCMKRASFEME